MTIRSRSTAAATLALCSMLSSLHVSAQRGTRGAAMPPSSVRTGQAAGASASPPIAADGMLDPVAIGEDAATRALGDGSLDPIAILPNDTILPTAEDGSLDPVAIDPTKQRPVRHADGRPVSLDVDDYERELAEAEAERARRQAEARKESGRTILVERWYVDPCGSFSVSWGGRRTCEPTKRRKWELVDVGADAKAEAAERPSSDGTVASSPDPGGSPGGLTRTSAGGATGGADAAPAGPASSSGAGGDPGAGRQSSGSRAARDVQHRQGEVADVDDVRFAGRPLAGGNAQIVTASPPTPLEPIW